MNQQNQSDAQMLEDIKPPATLGQPLSDFLLQLEDYTPTFLTTEDEWEKIANGFEEKWNCVGAIDGNHIPDAVTAYYLRTTGFEPKDPRLLRLISIAAQKFISDIANDALQHCKMRTSNSSTSHGSSKNSKGTKDRRYCLTMDDLIPALQEFGITIKKPHYYV